MHTHWPMLIQILNGTVLYVNWQLVPTETNMPRTICFAMASRTTLHVHQTLKYHHSLSNITISKYNLNWAWPILKKKPKQINLFILEIWMKRWIDKHQWSNVWQRKTTKIWKIKEWKNSTCWLVLVVIVKLWFSVLLKFRSHIITLPRTTHDGVTSNLQKSLKCTV